MGNEGCCPQKETKWVGGKSLEMIVVSWNVRGLGSGKKRGVIRESLRKINLDIVIIQETKKEILEERTVGSVWKARFRNWVSLPFTGRSGGILLIWDVRIVEVVDTLIGTFTVSIKIQKMEVSGGLLVCTDQCPIERDNFFGLS